MASLTKRCRHRGEGGSENCGCTYYIRRRVAGREIYTPVGPDRAAGERALRERPAATLPGESPPPPGASSIYFVQGGRLTKIGRACDVGVRIRDLQCGSPVPLTLMLTCPGGEKTERALHRHFAKDRQHGEWFRLPRDWQKQVVRVLAALIATE